MGVCRLDLACEMVSSDLLCLKWAVLGAQSWELLLCPQQWWGSEVQN